MELVAHGSVPSRQEHQNTQRQQLRVLVLIPKLQARRSQEACAVLLSARQNIQSEVRLDVRPPDQYGLLDVTKQIGSDVSGYLVCNYLVYLK
jgi:hypothetical protein